MLEMEEYVDKKYKADYMSLQLWYMTELKQLSIELKDPTVKMAPQGQDKLLHKRLVELNKWIDTQVRPKADETTNPETQAKYKGGIVFPFKQGDDTDPWVILSCIPELAVVFETKVRAPYRAVFEVCRLSELKQKLRSNEEAKQSPDEESKSANFGESGGTGGGEPTAVKDEEVDELELGEWVSISAKDL